MKLVRYEAAKQVHLGALSKDGKTVISLTRGAATSDRAPSSMTALLAQGEAGMEVVRRMAEAATGDSAMPLENVRLLAPIADPPKIMCIGQNYRDHCIEQNQPIPERAIMFSKFATAVNDPGATVHLLPGVSDQIDYEAELAVVIGGAGGGGRNIAESEALRHVAGYLCANDVTARDIQKGDGQWVRGKSPDGFFPIGPALVTADEIADPHDLDISLTLNGETMQKSNTSNLIFNIPYLIAYLSKTMTLLPGDIISTGTPGGVGVFRHPPIFLKAGDEMAVTISGLGTLTNRIAD